MGARGSRVQIAQNFEFGGRGRRQSRPRHRRTVRPRRCSSLICSRVTPGWMLFTVISLVSGSGRMMQRSVTRQRGPLGANAKRLAFAAGASVAERGEKVELADETARALLHHDKDLAAAGGDLRGASTARQPHLGLRVIADDRAIEIAEAVHLGSAQETDGDPSALQPVAEDLRYRHGGQCGLAEFAIADRKAAERRDAFAACRIRRSD